MAFVSEQDTLLRRTGNDSDGSKARAQPLQVSALGCLAHSLPFRLQRDRASICTEYSDYLLYFFFF